MPPDSAVLTEQGLEALGRYDWPAARELCNRALAVEESPQALEGLALAAWWEDDRSTAIDARERAHRLFRERGDARSAARMALWLSMDYAAFRGEPAISNGWLERARRLLEDVEPCEETCWSLYREALRTLRTDRDTDGALAIAREAVALARSLGCGDMELLALSFEGVTLVSRGDVGEGMRRLDQVSAAIVAGDIANRWATGLASCNLITGCERARDYERAGEWCVRLKELSTRWKHLPLFATCRTLYADVLLARGEWREAEAELISAIGELNALNMPMKNEAVVQLAELRRRQGRIDEARALALQAEMHPGSGLVRAELALDEGKAAEAVEMAERYLRRANPDNCTELGAGLELLVRAHVANGQEKEASARIAELEALCQRMAVKPGKASCSFARGLLCATLGQLDVARRHFEDAADLFSECDAPFESGRARTELGRTLFALGRRDEAAHEARRAVEILEGAGALTEAGRARLLLDSMSAAAPEAAAEPELTVLTRREQEVLRLIAQGLTNGEIAKRLFLSEHTVHRHVSNILAKLNLPSRAAAVAFAGARGLL